MAQGMTAAVISRPRLSGMDVLLLIPTDAQWNAYCDYIPVLGWKPAKNELI
jgi:hypothetical protein